MVLPEKIKVFSVVFGEPMYFKMAEAFRRSVEKNCPGAEIEIATMDRPKELHWFPRFVPDNIGKMELWNKEAQAATIPTVLIDIDTIVLRDLREGFADPFDLAYTIRPGGMPFNSGVVFVRPTDWMREFVARWMVLNYKIKKKGSHGMTHIAECAGVNQASFRDVLAELNGDRTGHLHALDCEEWNCEQVTWKDFSPEKTGVIHVKSTLRDVLFGQTRVGIPMAKRLAPLIAECKKYGYEGK